MEHGVCWRQVWPERMRGDFERDFLLDMGPRFSGIALACTSCAGSARNRTGGQSQPPHPRPTGQNAGDTSPTA
eukprot:650154-Prorocentrum_lima.AAC.1